MTEDRHGLIVELMGQVRQIGPRPALLDQAHVDVVHVGERVRAPSVVKEHRVELDVRLSLGPAPDYGGDAALGQIGVEDQLAHQSRPSVVIP